MVDPIDAALRAYDRALSDVPRIFAMQAAIEAYEAARAHRASQDALRAVAEQAQEAGLYETASTGLSTPPPAVASPQAPQTACGEMGGVTADTQSQKPATLSDIIDLMLADMAAEFEATLPNPGLTGDEGGE